VSGEGRHYVTVGRRLVVANRLRVGTIDGLGGVETNVPFYKRYFLGGAGSVRGWGRFEVSPLSGFGFPVGGHSMLEGSAEVRFPVHGKLGAVAFLDYGNVWGRSWRFDLTDLRYAVGPGLRYSTPIGPVRFDLGYQVNPIENLLVNGEPQKRRWRVHFSIGQAF
jgi:outer membrane protein assembly factor BamA